MWRARRSRLAIHIALFACLAPGLKSAQGFVAHLSGPRRRRNADEALTSTMEMAMIKAMQSLHPASESLNRRRVLTGAVTAAASVAGAGISHHAIAAPHVAAPTADGRRLLHLIANLREAYG